MAALLAPDLLSLGEKLRLLRSKSGAGKTRSPARRSRVREVSPDMAASLRLSLEEFIGSGVVAPAESALSKVPVGLMRSSSLDLIRLS